MEDGLVTKALRKGRHCGERRQLRDVVDRDHVDRVVDIWHKPQLNAALHQTPNEIVRIRNLSPIIISVLFLSKKYIRICAMGGAQQSSEVSCFYCCV